MRHALATALVASAALWSPAAQARDTKYRIDIGAGDLTDALASLSAQTGISLAMTGPLPRIASRAVRGEMTAREALERLLHATKLRAVRAGPLTYRLVPRRPATEVPSAEPEDAQPASDIVVTARKQSEALSAVAAPIAVYAPEAGGRPGGRSDAHDAAAGVEGLVLTHLGAGRDRLFIRGIADSPFNGFSQSTVSVQVDDARVTYDAAEPGLRLADIARVEILKGPQGPLYGTGALGGVYRIVTNRPVLGSVDGYAAGGTSVLPGGGIGAQAEAMANIPLVDDRVAIRAVGYVALDPGWINDVSGARAVNRGVTRGGRLSLRIAPAAGWTIDLAGAAQSIGLRDSQYVDRAGEDLTRDVSIREPRDSSLRLAQATVAGPVGALQLTIATSNTWQSQTDLYDASASAVTLGVSGAATYRDRRRYGVFDQEVRLGSAPGSRFTWTAGASYLSATTHALGELSSADTGWSPLFVLNRRATETALFADGAAPLADRLRLAIGVRVFRATTEDERQEDQSQAFTARASLGVTPSASLSYEIARDRLIYIRFGTAFRSGGIDPANTTTGRYDADEVRSFDLGGRLRLDGGRLSINGGLFLTSWAHVQSDYLEANGLIATRNVGSAMIPGGEVAADWRPGGGWRLKAGATLQHPRLIRAEDGTKLPADLRLPLQPDVTARLELARDIPFHAWRLAPYLSGNLVGAARLSFDDGLDRSMPGYVVARAGVAATSGALSARLDIDNLLDARADTFAFGNPFSVRSIRQYTPARPRTISISVSHRF